MKYNLTILSVLALNLGLTFAQDMQMLVAVGFPACAVPCIQSGNKAAADKHGCGLMDGVCQCTTGYKTAQEVVMNCIVSTKPCGDADMAKIGAAGANLCTVNKQAGSSNSTSATKSGTGAIVSASASASAGGAKPAASPTMSHNAARPERTFAVGAMGLVGAVVALAL